MPIISSPVGANKTLSNLNDLGIAAQVLTSNGAGAAPTFQDAAGGGGTDRVNFSWMFETPARYAVQTEGSGTNTFNSIGITQATGATNVSSITVQLSPPGGATTNVFSSNPHFFAYIGTANTAGTHHSYWGFGNSVTIDGTAGVTATANQIGFKDIVTAGSQVSSATNANGTTETATTLTALGSETVHRISAKFTTGTNIKYYVDGVLGATHTTNLPASNASSRLIQAGISSVNTSSSVNHVIAGINLGWDI